MGWSLGLLNGITSIPVLLVTGGWFEAANVITTSQADLEDSTLGEETNL